MVTMGTIVDTTIIITIVLIINTVTEIILFQETLTRITAMNLIAQNLYRLPKRYPPPPPKPLKQLLIPARMWIRNTSKIFSRRLVKLLLKFLILIEKPELRS